MEVIGELHILSAPFTNWIRDSVGLRSDMDVVKKRKIIAPVGANSNLCID
jgi:hypothetical protein